MNAHVGSDIFPSFVTSLPQADLPMDGLRGWTLRAENMLVVFMAADRDVVVPEHHHGEQWGIVLEGEMDVTMHGRTQTYRRGDTHCIPAGVEHGAMIRAGWRGLYVFPRP